MFSKFFSSPKESKIHLDKYDFLSEVEYLSQALTKPKKWEQEKVKRKFAMFSQVLATEDVVAKEDAIVGAGLEVLIEQDLLFNWSLLTSTVDRDYTEEERLLVREYRRMLIDMTAFLVGAMGYTFLFNKAVRSALNLLVKEESMVKVSDCFMEFVQLEYQLCVRILESEELLDLFFVTTNESICDGDASKKVRGSFPVVDRLLQLVHLEGDRGDYARAAFEALIKQASPENNNLDTYLLSTEFASILLAYVTGIFTRLPDVLAFPNEKHRLDPEMKRFEKGYVFLQNCLKTPSQNVKQKLLKQIHEFFLSQVVLSSMIASNDLDGSAETILFYIQFMVDITEDQDLLEVITSFLFYMPSIQDDTHDLPLCPREILFSKLNSLSELVLASVLQLLYSFLSKGNPTFLLPLLFTTLAEESLSADRLSPLILSQIDMPDYNSLLPREATISRPSYEPYLSNATASLSLKPLERNERASFVTKDETSSNLTSYPNFRQRVEKYRQEWILQKLFSKLDSFFSQTLEINIALANIFSLIATKSNDGALIVALFERNSNGPCIYDALLRLNNQIEDYKATATSYDVRLLLARHKLSSDVFAGTPSDLQIEGEMVKNIVILEEFAKNMVSIVVDTLDNKLLK